MRIIFLKKWVSLPIRFFSITLSVLKKNIAQYWKKIGFNIFEFFSLNPIFFLLRETYQPTAPTLEYEPSTPPTAYWMTSSLYSYVAAVLASSLRLLPLRGKNTEKKT